MTYDNFINNIINERGRFGCGDEYCERHHIIPKCLGGSDVENNLVDLFAKEHFIAHKLLAKENPHNKKLIYAWWMISHIDNREITSEEYEEVRIAFISSNSGKNNANYGNHKLSGSNNHRARSVVRIADDKIYPTCLDCAKDNQVSETTIHTWLKQRRAFVYYDEWIQLSYEDRQYLKSIRWDEIEHNNRSEGAKGKFEGCNNPFYGKHHTEQTKSFISNKNKGFKHTEESKKHMSESRTGDKNSFFGKKHSEESKRKQSENSMGSRNGRSKAVYCPQLDQAFASTREAERVTGICYRSIALCANGDQKYAGRHPVTNEQLTWQFINNTNLKNDIS